MFTFDLILSVFPVAESFFAAAFLAWLYFKTKALHHVYLHIFYALLGMFYLMSVFFYLNDFPAISFLFTFSLPVTLSLFPAFYMYLRSLTGSELPSIRVKILHFTPPVLFLLVLLPFQFLPYDVRIAYVSRENPSWLNDYPLLGYIKVIYRIAVTYFINFQFVVYLYLMSRELVHYRKRIEERFSFKEQINLEWAVYSIFFFAMLTILINFSHYIGVSVFVYSRIVFNVISVIIIFFLFIKGFSQRNVFVPEKMTLKEIIPDIPELYIDYKKENSTAVDDNLATGKANSPQDSKPKYQHSTLTLEARTRIIDELELLVADAHFFFQKNLDIDQLSEQLKTNSTYVSQIINENFEKNFFHFVNEIRIKEAQKLLGDPGNDKYTIEALANSCGFNSRSSFHSAFKKVTGMTPAEYRNARKQ